MELREEIAREIIAEVPNLDYPNRRDFVFAAADAILALDEIQKWKRAYDEQVEMDRKLGHKTI